MGKFVPLGVDEVFLSFLKCGPQEGFGKTGNFFNIGRQGQDFWAPVELLKVQERKNRFYTSLPVINLPPFSFLLPVKSPAPNSMFRMVPQVSFFLFIYWGMGKD